MPRKGSKYLITVSLSYSLYLKLEEKAREHNKSRSEIIEEALKKYFEAGGER